MAADVVRQGCQCHAGKNCEQSPKDAKAGCFGVAIEAISNHAAYSWDLVD
jgi:hypothetical protein